MDVADEGGITPAPQFPPGFEAHIVARSLLASGDTENALKKLEDSVRERRDHPPRDKRATGAALHDWAAALARTGKLDDAEAKYAEALAELDDALEEALAAGDAPETSAGADAARRDPKTRSITSRAAAVRLELGSTRADLARTLARRGDHDGAVGALDVALADLRAGGGGASAESTMLCLRGRSLVEIGRMDQGLTSLVDAARVLWLEAVPEPDGERDQASAAAETHDARAEDPDAVTVVDLVAPGSGAGKAEAALPVARSSGEAAGRGAGGSGADSRVPFCEAASVRFGEAAAVMATAGTREASTLGPALLHAASLAAAVLATQPREVSSSPDPVIDAARHVVAAALAVSRSDSAGTDDDHIARVDAVVALVCADGALPEPSAELSDPLTSLAEALAKAGLASRAVAAGEAAVATVKRCVAAGKADQDDLAETLLSLGSLRAGLGNVQGSCATLAAAADALVTPSSAGGDPAIADPETLSRIAFHCARTFLLAGNPRDAAAILDDLTERGRIAPAVFPPSCAAGAGAGAGVTIDTDDIDPSTMCAALHLRGTAHASLADHPAAVQAFERERPFLSSTGSAPVPRLAVSRTRLAASRARVSAESGDTGAVAACVAEVTDAVRDIEAGMQLDPGPGEPPSSLPESRRWLAAALEAASRTHLAARAFDSARSAATRGAAALEESRLAHRAPAEAACLNADLALALADACDGLKDGEDDARNALLAAGVSIQRSFSTPAEHPRVKELESRAAR